MAGHKIYLWRERHENTYKSRCHQHKRGREFIELQPSSDLKSGLLQASWMALLPGGCVWRKEKWTRVNAPWISNYAHVCQELGPPHHHLLSNAGTVRELKPTKPGRKTKPPPLAMAESSNNHWIFAVCWAVCKTLSPFFKEAEAQRCWETWLRSHSSWQTQGANAGSGCRATALILPRCPDLPLVDNTPLLSSRTWHPQVPGLVSSLLLKSLICPQIIF